MRTLMYSTLFLLLSAGATQALDLTECDQVIPRGETGVLQVDLVCPTGPGYCEDFPAIECEASPDCPSGYCHNPSAIRMESYATLQLNGHTVKGGASAVRCGERRCTIRGPGQILGADAPDRTYIGVLFRRQLEISDVLVQGAATGVISGGTWGRLEATNLTSNGHESWGIRVGKLLGSNITTNGNAGSGLELLRLRATDITANGNGDDGVTVHRSVIASNITANDNGWTGVLCRRCTRVTGLSASGNHLAGVLAFRGGMRLFESDVTGNGVTAGTLVDVASTRRPRILDTSCGRSARWDREHPFWSEDPELGFLGTWEVCSND